MAETHCEKLEEAELEIWETQWPMCKAEALVDPLANTAREVESQTSLETLVELKAEALVLENEDALPNKLTHTITEAKKILLPTPCAKKKLRCGSSHRFTCLKT